MAACSSGSGFDDELQPPDRVLSFYSNSTILVTGGTGFLGKVLLEKILRCLNVRKVFLAVRSKDGRNADERLQDLLKDVIFDRLRMAYTVDQLLERIEAVEISLEEPNGGEGLSMDSVKEGRLLVETELIFNVLASVKFNECIKNAIGTNVGGTRRILQLARRMHRLKSVVHVSTLYSNCDRTRIQERVYPDSPLNPDSVLQLSKMLSTDEMSQLQHCLLGELPNTYTFSKKCAESLIQQEFADLPIGIFRPPIVLSTYREPIAGWTDNLNGPAGLCLWTVKGYVRVIRGNGHKKANLVPVDYCVNALLVACFDVAERSIGRRQQHDPEPVESAEAWESPQLVPVYNYMYEQANLTWGRYMSSVSMGFDGWIKRLCCYRRMVTKTNRFLETMAYFGLREWHIANENVVRLRTLLTPTEASMLEFDLSTIDWDEYFQSYIPGIRRYFLAERGLSKQPVGSGRVKSLQWHRSFMFFPVPHFPFDFYYSDPSKSRRAQFLYRLACKLLWVYVCLKLGHRLYVVRNLFSILIS
uniref:Fatty acyl-CoA reductase n=1 Tax=Anopheles stephensi TaxID=30069 RepID=A0A182YMH8_ANOST